MTDVVVTPQIGDGKGLLLLLLDQCLFGVQQSSWDGGGAVCLGGVHELTVALQILHEAALHNESFLIPIHCAKFILIQGS